MCQKHEKEVVKNSSGGCCDEIETEIDFNKIIEILGAERAENLFKVDAV